MNPTAPQHIALVTGSLGEGAGGLASAVRALALGLANAGVKVGLFSLQLEQAFGPATLPMHDLIENFVVPCVFEPRTRLTLAPRFKAQLSEYCQRNNVALLHCNGVWLAGTRTTANVARKLGIPYVLSPHGHIQPWAMNNKPWKKKLAWKAYGERCLRDAALIHAGSEFELASVRQLGIARPVAQIPNMIELPTQWPETLGDKGDGRHTVLFLSRLHPSKGLLDLVAAWKQLQPEGWRVVVAGPDEGGHLAQVHLAVQQAGLQSDFDFIGAVAYAERWRWYRQADLYVLPTYSENFGIGIAEALGAGTPVITTRAAPWRLLEELGCGWWLQTGPRALAQGLAQAVALSAEERRTMGDRGQALVRERYSPQAVSKAMLSAYTWAIHGGNAPAFIEV